MGIEVGVRHRTAYHYDRPVHLGPQVVRLRRAPHTRTPILSDSVHVEPENHFVNCLSRCPGPGCSSSIERHRKRPSTRKRCTDPF